MDKLKDMKKEASMSIEKKVYQDGMVQATVKGIKGMFPLSNIFISSYNGSVADLVKEVENQREINKKQQQINRELLKQIKTLKEKVDKYVG